MNMKEKEKTLEGQWACGTEGLTKAYALGVGKDRKWVLEMKTLPTPYQSVGTREKRK